MPPRPAPIHETQSTGQAAILTVAFFLVAVASQWLLLSNPGYFSHDELGWALRADVPTLDAMPWASWADIETFQYRPLTFNLWLLFVHGLHDSPVIFHALWVAFGIAIAFGLRTVLKRLDASPLLATLAAFVFLLNPYAVYVHGWVATLADLIWVGAGLLLTLWLLRDRTATLASGHLIAAGMATATIGLLAKEAAIVLAPLAWFAWWLSMRQRRWLWVAVGLSIPTAIYLILRIDVILNAPRPDDSYQWSLASLPATWLKYHLYPYLPTTIEIGPVFRSSPGRLAAAIGLFAATIAAVFAAGWRIGTALVVGSALALGPVLLLDVPYNQYGYGMSLIVVAALALSWRRSRWWARMALSLAAAVCIWHGSNVQRAIHHAGELQAVFTTSLRQVVVGNDRELLRLAPEHPGDAWIYQRLIHEPSTYGAGPDGPRAVIVMPGEPADLRIALDGRVTPSPAP